MYPFSIYVSLAQKNGLPEHMAGRDLASLRLLDVGGGPVPEKLKEDLRRTLGVEQSDSVCSP